MTVGRLERAKKVFFIALGIDIAATVFVVASSYWIVGVLNGISAGALPRGPTIVERIDLLESFSRVLFLTMVGVGWTLFRWLDACYAHVRGTLNVRGLQHEKWKIWGWVLPFFNLFKPYQMLSELYKAGGTGAGGDDWKKAPGSGALLAWWVYWTVAHLVMVMIGKEVLKLPSSGGLSLNQVVGIKEAQIALCLVSLTVAGLWFAVAGNLTNRLVRGHPKSASGVASSSSAFVAAVRAGNDAYAEALSEIEEGRLDKGVWARAFADAGGEAEKAKALYIRARAEALKDGEVWEDTQPRITDATSEKSPNSASRWHIADDIRNMHPGVKAGAILVLLLLFGSLVSPGFRQGLWGLEARHATEARNGTQRMEQASPDQSDWGKGDKPIQTTPAWGEKDAIAPPPGNPASVGNSQISDFLSGKPALGKQPSQIDGFLGSPSNPSIAAPAKPPNGIYKCTGPNGVVYQATPCNATSN